MPSSSNSELDSIGEPRVAVVVGASRGLGKSLSTLLVQEGYSVIVGCRRIYGAIEADGSDANLGSPFHAIDLDVTQEDSVADAVRATKNLVGRCDLLILNAADPVDFGKPLGRSTRDQWLRGFEVNVVGNIHTALAFSELLQKSGTPMVVFVSSILGSFKNIDTSARARDFRAGWAVGYSASKAALNMAALHLSGFFHAKGIEVRVVHPGWLRTELGGARAPLSPDEGARDVFTMLQRPRSNGERLMLTELQDIRGTIDW